MSRQAEAFLESEGDAFYKRNRDKSRFPDPVLDAIGLLGLTKKSKILEVGCGDGWRLEFLNRNLDARCHGVEASAKAAARARERGLLGVVWESYPDVNFAKNSFDLIIFGFCLYLVDRDELFEWVFLSDGHLKDGGYIVIHDFFPEYPYRRPYAHKEGLWSYKMNYSQLWLAHPGYKEVRTDLFGEDDERIGVAVLQKDFINAFPLRD